MSAKRALAGFRAPGEAAAEQRAWAVVRADFREREPVAARRSLRRPAGGLAAALVLAGALALSPAGATVSRLIDHALGVRHPAPALFPLPAPGRLLASGPSGTWIVAADGANRRIGRWTEASWSPHGRYLAVAQADGLAAVNPRGVTQWRLARPHVSDARWYAPTGYRVAYLSGDALRVVAGDGTGDHLVSTRAAHVAPAWRAGHPYQLAFVSATGMVAVRDGDTGAPVWSANPHGHVTQLAWSGDGDRLLALSRYRALVYDGAGRLVSSWPAPGDVGIVAGALSPDGRRLAIVTGGYGSAVVVYDITARHPAARRVLAGTGIGQLAWSPNAQWVLVSWPAANQWVFVRVVGPPRIAAVSRISQQFSGGSLRRFPHLDGWCCNATGAAG